MWLICKLGCQPYCVFLQQGTVEIVPELVFFEIYQKLIMSFTYLWNLLHISGNLNVFFIQTGIGAPADHKRNKYKKQDCRKKKCMMVERKTRKEEIGSYECLVRVFYLKRYNNWIDKEKKMKSIQTYYESNAFLLLSSIINGIASTGCFPSWMRLSILR